MPLSPNAPLAWHADERLEATPIIVGKRVFTISDSTVRARDARTGVEQWSVRLHVGKDPGGLAYDNGRVFVASFYSIVALKASTGRVLWVRTEYHGDRIGGAFPPTVAAGRVFVQVDDHSRLIALDQRDGRVLWRQILTHVTGVSSPTVGHNIVYDAGPVQQTYAYDVRTGTRLWYADSGLIGGANAPPTQLYRGRLYVRDNNSIRVLDAATGARVRDIGPVAALPFAFADGVAFVTQLTNSTSVVEARDVRTWRRLWQFTAPADWNWNTSFMPQRTAMEPFVVDDHVWLATVEHDGSYVQSWTSALYVLNARSGALEAIRPLPSPALMSDDVASRYATLRTLTVGFAAGSGLLVVGTLTEGVYAFGRYRDFGT